MSIWMKEILLKLERAAHEFFLIEFREEGNQKVLPSEFI
jgi:hypothetical protein